MDLIKRSEVLSPSSVVKSKQLAKICLPQKRKNILPEDEYTEKIEKIITKDFFPDLPKLKAQNEYLDAVGRGDVARIQEMQMEYQLTESTRSRFNYGSTPAAFETPDTKSVASPTRTEVDFDDSASIITVSEKVTKSLDQFLAENTSEDNASFQTIVEKSDLAHKQKYPWLYKDEAAEQKKLDDMLALPSSEKKAIEGEKPETLTWAYKNRNALMYVPDGVDFTPEERLSQGKGKVINHINTRFEAPPFDEDANREAIAEAASHQAKMSEGRVGIDGKEIIPGESPQVNGYGFVGTPAPAPGITDTPIMTWGEIEGTPFRLDGGDTPLPQNPSSQQFKMPGLSARERIAHSLADKAAQKHRRPKKNPLQSSLMRFGSDTPKTSMDRLHSMSPAAQKLARAKLGIQRNTDSALRASYSPSPLHTPSASKTPLTLTTPNVTPVTKTVITPSHTEALLNGPRRQKASDFF